MLLDALEQVVDVLDARQLELLAGVELEVEHPVARARPRSGRSGTRGCRGATASCLSTRRPFGPHLDGGAEHDAQPVDRRQQPDGAEDPPLGVDAAR